jgi:hypothetical protein
MIQVSTEFVTFVLHHRLIKLSKKLDTVGQVYVIVLYSVSPLVAVICRDSSCSSMRHLPCSLWVVIGTRWEVQTFVTLQPVTSVPLALHNIPLMNETDIGLNLILIKLTFCGPGSSVGIATVYGLDGPGIESRWEQDIPHRSRPALGPTQHPVQWVPDLSRG